MSFIRTYKWLLPMLAFTGMLLAGRIWWSGSFTFLFIPWNLFLALVPLCISYYMSKAANAKTGWLLFVAWLLFFPNAMYIVTDLFHLKKHGHIPLWYDLLILFSAAMNGLVVGFISFSDVEQFLSRQISRRYIPALTLMFFFLCGYGIYLGRYLRWNSWDVVTDPLSLIDDIREDVFHPLINHECWMLTVLFGTWLYILYRYFKAFRKGMLAQVTAA